MNNCAASPSGSSRRLVIRHREHAAKNAFRSTRTHSRIIRAFSERPNWNKMGNHIWQGWTVGVGAGHHNPCTLNSLKFQVSIWPTTPFTPMGWIRGRSCPSIGRTHNFSSAHRCITHSHFSKQNRHLYFMLLKSNVTSPKSKCETSRHHWKLSKMAK